MEPHSNPSTFEPVEPDATPALESATPEAATAFAESVAIMARLRGPGGCPWDREQSFDSIRKYTLEETYEVLDAIERRDWPNLAEELGDLLLQVLFYSQMAADEGRFTIADVLGTLNRKLIRRHPHVFGEEASAAAGNRAIVDSAVDGSAARVLANWEQIKLAEKKAAGDKAAASLLDQVQRAQPALAEAAKLGSKAAKVGFDWSHWRDLLAKVSEETEELVLAVESRETAQQQIPFGNDRQKSKGNEFEDSEVEAELGDLLFTVVNLGRHLGVDGEMALRGTNARFRARFREMERVAPRPLAELGPEELEALWAGAKMRLARAANTSGAEVPQSSDGLMPGINPRPTAGVGQ
jgi:MazG family protein